MKDELTTVKIYLRLSYQDSTCSASSDPLKTRLEAVKGVWDVKILPIKKVAVFYMYSSQPISERKLRELVRQTGFILLKIDYSKEEPEEEKDGRSANILK